jgi:hypothetical protein
MATTKKKAIDQIAKDYWTEYFKEYGKMWVRDIPGKVKDALDASSKTAHAEQGIKYDLVPVGYSVTASRLALDGIVRRSGASQLFCAEFNHDGDLVSFKVHAG